MIRVLIADDHGLIRRGIILLLEGASNIEIIGEAKDGKDALQKVKLLKPDVLIADISMPGTSGIELTQNLKLESPETHVLILSNYFDEEYILESYEAGALGFLPKNADEKLLVSAIERIAAGKLFYAPSVLDILGTSVIARRSPGKSLKSWLTEREKEILKELVDGSTNKQIAEKLFISSRTVDAHRRNIMKKLNVNNSAQLVKISLEKKLV